MNQTATRVLRVGTRGSLLAKTQAGTVRDALVAAGHEAELVFVKTAGDLSSDPVAKIGVGVFTTALRDELAAGHVDVELDLATGTRGPRVTAIGERFFPARLHAQHRDGFVDWRVRQAVQGLQAEPGALSGADAVSSRTLDFSEATWSRVISPEFAARCSSSQDASCISRVVRRMLSVA